MTALARVPFWAWLAVGVALAACKAPATPQGDALDRLAVAVEHAEASVPLARAACGLVPDPDRRRYCEGAVDAVEEAALVGRQLLAAVAVCREEQDAECVAGALDTAERLLRVLQPPHHTGVAP